MLTSVQIGENGRLGNQMFQYATLVAIAVARGYKWALQKNESVDLWKVFKMPNADVLTQDGADLLKFRYVEPSFHFDASVFLVEDFTDLYGYFQSPIYFGNCFDMIIEDFSFHDHIIDEANLKLQKYFTNIPSYSIHVRRGDYLLKSDYHPPCSIEYYQKAKSMILGACGGNARFLLFGDDHEWIKQNLLDDQSTLVEGNTPEVDMCMMSRCAGHIISNSSFSWWAAILGNFRTVIAPQAWFGPNGPSRWDTLYVQEWFQI